MSLKENRELNSLLGSKSAGASASSRPTKNPPQPNAYYDEDEDFDEESLTKAYCQWTSHNGKVFVPASKTKGRLTPGIYEIDSNPSVGLYFERIPVKTEGLLRFPDTNSDKIVDEIAKFWESEDIFRKYDLAYKRGIILWGPAGSGKSSTSQLIMADVVKRGGIVVKFDEPYIFIDGMRTLRAIQPETPVVVMMEDIDSIIETYHESEVLNILDGVNEVDKTVFLACPSPDHLILKADLTWVRADSLAEGDELIGFDEEGPNRKYRTSKVNSCPLVERLCFRVTTERGSFIVSENHPFLVKVGNKPHVWRTVEQLRPGSQIASIGDSWTTDESREAGYLAGQLDGEGTINFEYNVESGSHGFRVAWIQAQGEVSNLYQELLHRRNFNVAVHTRTPSKCGINGPCKTKDSITVRGGRWENLRLLGTIRPYRLLSHPKIREAWEGVRLVSKYVKIVSIEPIGMGPVVALDTTTKTFIGEGLLQHNTTNYPDRLGARIINRPSRFDKRFKIGFPSAASRKLYFEYIIGNSDFKKGRKEAKKLGIDLKRWVKDTHEMSIAHLKELFIAVVILGDPYDEAIKTLRTMTEEIDEKEYGDFGFDVGGTTDRALEDGFEKIEDWD